MDRVGRADVVGVNNPHETKVFQVATDKEVGHAFCPAGKTWIPPNVRLWPKADTRGRVLAPNSAIWKFSGL